MLTLIVVVVSAATQEAIGGDGGIERGSRRQNEEREETAGTVGTTLITQPLFVNFYIRSEIQPFLFYSVTRVVQIIHSFWCHCYFRYLSLCSQGQRKT